MAREKDTPQKLQLSQRDQTSALSAPSSTLATTKKPRLADYKPQRQTPEMKSPRSCTGPASNLPPTAELRTSTKVKALAKGACSASLKHDKGHSDSTHLDRNLPFQASSRSGLPCLRLLCAFLASRTFFTETASHTFFCGVLSTSTKRVPLLKSPYIFVQLVHFTIACTFCI